MAHISTIDLNLFVVLDAIYGGGGVTRASEKLHLTQPAVSHALARLRELFGDPLFVRRGHAMIPTPLARTVIEPVRRSLRLLGGTLDETGRFDPTRARQRFTIGVRDMLESTALPALFRRMTDSAPEVDLAAVRVERRDLESALAAGTVDAAIDVSLGVPSDVRSRPIVVDRLVVVARKRHPAANGSLDLATYLAAGHVLVSSRRRGSGAEDAELAKLGLERRVRLRCQSYFAACRVVGETDLLLTMPERYARVLNQKTSNQILPMPLDSAPLTLHLYWHSTMDRDPANRWLRGQLVEAFRGS
jgi:DNA-binding transcriptional LysR family regulator